VTPDEILAEIEGCHIRRKRVLLFQMAGRLFTLWVVTWGAYNASAGDWPTALLMFVLLGINVASDNFQTSAVRNIDKQLAHLHQLGLQATSKPQT
jgi:hypothetical protein